MKNSKVKQIAIIDDDQTILSALEIVLSDFGYKVKTISDSQKAVLKLMEFKPDLIFLDLIMPVMDGEEVLKNLKLNKFLKNIPVILLSASSTIEDVAARHNVAGYIKKPFDIDQIYSLINSRLSPIA